MLYWPVLHWRKWRESVQPDGLSRMLECLLHDGLSGSFVWDCDTWNPLDFESVRFAARDTKERSDPFLPLSHPPTWKRILMTSMGCKRKRATKPDVELAIKIWRLVNSFLLGSYPTIVSRLRWETTRPGVEYVHAWIYWSKRERETDRDENK